LEMMLRGPQHVEAELVHGLRDIARRKECLAQPLVRIAPIVRRRAVDADIVELDLTDIEHVELVDHRASAHFVIIGVKLASKRVAWLQAPAFCISLDSMTEFTPHQDAALKAVATWLKDRSGARSTPQIFRLFGYAGTGKTTLARHLAAHIDGEVKFAA